MAETNNSYNVQQLTNFSITDKPSLTKTIEVPILEGKEIQMVPIQIAYKTALEVKQDNNNMGNLGYIKFGYCCEPKGIIFPIFICTNKSGLGNYFPIQIGREGMYEFQNETFKDINAKDEKNGTSSKEVETDIKILGIQVPADLKFTLDYISAIN